MKKELIDEITQDMYGVISYSFSFNGILDELDIELDGNTIDKERLEKILLLIDDVRDRVSLTITYNYR